MDGGRRGAHNGDACIFEALRQSEWCLATELHDDAHDGSLSLLGIDNFQDVFARQGFEIETIGGVVVRGDGFRVAIDHDRFETGVGERQCSVDARVVELDALTDAIRAGSEDDHLLAARWLQLIFLVVGGVVVGVIASNSAAHVSTVLKTGRIPQACLISRTSSSLRPRNCAT